uniref:Uncharacterized protein K0155C03.23 n=1 Tax=Oryza sativa subsp. indica TaxID=39946 RepID=C8TFG6_ORYSI|nr:hypothetical protein [Oryza sativa Indica Group]
MNHHYILFLHEGGDLPTPLLIVDGLTPLGRSAPMRLSNLILVLETKLSKTMRKKRKMLDKVRKDTFPGSQSKCEILIADSRLPSLLDPTLASLELTEHRDAKTGKNLSKTSQDDKARR